MLLQFSVQGHNRFDIAWSRGAITQAEADKPAISTQDVAGSLRCSAISDVDDAILVALASEERNSAPAKTSPAQPPYHLTKFRSDRREWGILGTPTLRSAQLRVM